MNKEFDADHPMVKHWTPVGSEKEGLCEGDVLLSYSKGSDHVAPLRVVALICDDRFLDFGDDYLVTIEEQSWEYHQPDFEHWDSGLGDSRTNYRGVTFKASPALIKALRDMKEVL